MSDIYQESLDLHEQNHGKLTIKSKVPLQDRTDLARAYTPGVAAACTAIGKDKSLAYKYTIKANMVAVVSDGSAILGLGNLGPEAALPVMEGKAILFKAFGGVDAFPICLDTQNVEEIIKAVKLIAPGFGGINLEDISAPRCFEIEERLMNELNIPVMHDDQHGTATVVLAALINALKVKGTEAPAMRVVLSGAGAAGTAITKMLLTYGFNDIIVCDTKGAISKERADLNPSKKVLAEITNPRSVSGNLAQVIKQTDIFIGVSAPGVLTPEMVHQMNLNPIIFALANPVPEIMPDEAKAAGALVVATGRSDFANQVNNVLVFPGVFRGALDHNVKRIEKSMLVQAAKNLAACVPAPDATHILPDPFDPEVAKRVADAIR